VRLEASFEAFYYRLVESQTFPQITGYHHKVYRPKVRFCIRL